MCLVCSLPTLSPSGLKFKNDKPNSSHGPTKAGGAGDRSAPLAHPAPGFKVKTEAGKRDPLLEDIGSAAAGSAAGASTAAAGASATIAPPIVLASPVARSSWGLHKNELHEIDANLTLLREHDRQVERLEGTSKKEIVEREKRMVEEQIAARAAAAAAAQATQVVDFSGASSLAPGVKFSVPNASNINKQYLFRQEATVSDATSRLDQRIKKKADRYCK